MEEQIQNIENQLGFITLEISLAENEADRLSLEDKYKEQIEMLSMQLEQLKNN